MNLREANLEAQRRWGPCGCAWFENGSSPHFGGFTVGVLVTLGGKTVQRILGQGMAWEMAFQSVLPTLMACGMAIGDDFKPRTDEEIRDMGVLSSDVDPRHRLAVERVQAAVADAKKICPNGSESDLVAVTGFILAERART